MSTNRSRRIDHDTAEHLLGGVAVGSSAGQSPLTGQAPVVPGHAALAGLLAAAAAPAAGDGSLPGEEDALAAFREARRSPAPEPRRRTMASTASARAFSAKALAAAFAVTALGGVAVAAVTGNLPAVLGGHPGPEAPAAVHTPAGSPSQALALAGQGGRGSSMAPTATGSSRPTVGPSAPGTSQSRTPDGTPPMLGLCRTYAERLAAGTKIRLLLADPLLAPLVKAAGGVGGVDAYCTAVVAKSKGNDPAGGPSQGSTKDGPTKLTDLPTRLGGTGLPSGPPDDRNGWQSGGVTQ